MRHRQANGSILFLAVFAVSTAGSTAHGALPPLTPVLEEDAGRRGILVHPGCGDGSELWTLSAADGGIISQTKLDEMPIFDGMIVADDRLYLCTTTGEVICMGGG